MSEILAVKQNMNCAKMSAFRSAERKEFLVIVKHRKDITQTKSAYFHI